MTHSKKKLKPENSRPVMPFQKSMKPRKHTNEQIKKKKSKR